MLIESHLCGGHSTGLWAHGDRPFQDGAYSQKGKQVVT